MLTGISSLCNDVKLDQCPLNLESEEHGGETVFCVCPCHQVPAEA